MNVLALLLVVMLILTLAVAATGRFTRLAWEIVVTLALILMLLGNVI